MVAKKRMKKKSSKFGRKKKCRFCVNPQMEISYKNERMLQRYVSDRGKIVARRVTGNCAKHQREITTAIKRARIIAILPYTSSLV